MRCGVGSYRPHTSARLACAYPPDNHAVLVQECTYNDSAYRGSVAIRIGSFQICFGVLYYDIEDRFSSYEILTDPCKLCISRKQLVAT